MLDDHPPNPPYPPSLPNPQRVYHPSRVSSHPNPNGSSFVCLTGGLFSQSAYKDKIVKKTSLFQLFKVRFYQNLHIQTPNALGIVFTFWCSYQFQLVKLSVKSVGCWTSKFGTSMFLIQIPSLLSVLATSCVIIMLP